MVTLIEALEEFVRSCEVRRMEVVVREGNSEDIEAVVYHHCSTIVASLIEGYKDGRLT